MRIRITDPSGLDIPVGREEVFIGLVVNARLDSGEAMIFVDDLVEELGLHQDQANARAAIAWIQGCTSSDQMLIRPHAYEEI